MKYIDFSVEEKASFCRINNQQLYLSGKLHRRGIDRTADKNLTCIFPPHHGEGFSMHWTRTAESLTWGRI